MHAIETFERDGWTVSLYQDIDAESPESWDQLATFERDSEPERGWPVHVRWLTLFGKAVAVLPLRMADYGSSGIWLSETDPENANAVMFTTHERINELCGDDPKYHTREWVTEALRGELAEWTQYFDGDVYGYVVRDPEGNETDDGSLWGLYGSQYAEREAREALDREIVAYAERQVEIARGWALARMGG